MKSSNNISSRQNGSHAIDALVGQRIRARRLELKMNQTELGKAVGISFQQIQKYEKGTNRVGASRLSALAFALQVSVTYFFDEGVSPSLEAPALCDPSSVALVRAFRQIKDPLIRCSLLELFRSVAVSISRKS